MGGMVPCQRVDPYQSQRGISGNKVDNALVEPNIDPGGVFKLPLPPLGTVHFRIPHLSTLQP